MDVLGKYNLDDTTKSVWGISRSYDNVFLDPDVVCVLVPEDPAIREDVDLVWHTADYVRVLEKMLVEWPRIRVTRPAFNIIASHRDELKRRYVPVREGATRDERSDAIQDYLAAVESVHDVLRDRIAVLEDDAGEVALFGHLSKLLILLEERIGIVKTSGTERERMIHQVCLMYVLTLTRRGECAVLASEQGYEGLITIPFRNLLAREVDDPDSPLNVLRGSRVTAILPDDSGKFRRNFVSSWVSPNERVFVTVGGVEDTEAREQVLALIREIIADLRALGHSGEKYRLDIGTDTDSLEGMFEDLIQRMPRPAENQITFGIETMAPVWEKLGEICGVLGFHAKRDEALRQQGSVRGKRFAVEVEKMRRLMDEICRDPDWHSTPEKIDAFQQVQRDMSVLLDRRRRR